MLRCALWDSSLLTVLSESDCISLAIIDLPRRLVGSLRTGSRPNTYRSKHVSQTSHFGDPEVKKPNKAPEHYGDPRRVNVRSGCSLAGEQI